MGGHGFHLSHGVGVPVESGNRPRHRTPIPRMGGSGGVLRLIMGLFSCGDPKEAIHIALLQSTRSGSVASIQPVGGPQTCGELGRVELTM